MDISFGREVIAAAGVGAAFLLVMGVAEVWRRRWSPPTEWTRKFVHVASGVIAAFFPWIFHTHVTPLVLGGLMIAIFTIAKRLGWLGAVLDVERASSGERWFSVGVYLLFLVGRTRPVFYVIALGTLVVSDTMAALIGSRYGSHTFDIGEGRKSLEGSGVFLFATFLVVLLPLLLLTNIGHAECVLIALQLAFITTCFESIAVGGSDNVIVPLAVFFLLIKMTPYDWGWIGLQLLAQLALLVVVLVVARWNRFLSFAGAIAAHLVLYAAFSLGHPSWTVAPLLALIGYFLGTAMRHREGGMPGGGHQVEGVFYVSIVATVLVFADNGLANAPWFIQPWAGQHPLFAPFVGALAAPLAITFARHHRSNAWPGAGRRWLAGGGAALVLVAAAGLVAGGSSRIGYDLLFCSAVTACALAMYSVAYSWRGTHRSSDAAAAIADMRLQSVASASAVVILTPVYLRLTGFL
jgi:phytol kinase